MDREDFKMLLIFGGIPLLLITILVVLRIDWGNKCEEIGGVVESRYEYTQFNYDPTTGTVSSQEIYSDHCMVNGKEVEI